jgi:hypothetical protein
MDRQLPPGSVPTIRRPRAPSRDRTGRSHEPDCMGLAPVVGWPRGRTRRRIVVLVYALASGFSPGAADGSNGYVIP